MRNPIKAKKMAQFKEVTDIYPRPIIEINLKGTVLEWNTYAKKLFPDLKEKGSRHPYLSDLPKITASLLNTRRPVGRDIQLKGRWYKQRFYYFPKLKLIHVYGSDATARKKMEQALQESEHRYHSLFSEMSEAYALHEIIVDAMGNPYDYKFLDANHAFEEISGLKRKDIINKTIQQILPKTELSWIQDYGKVALTGEAEYFERHDKYSDKYYRVFAYQPAPNQFATIFFDITDLKLIDVEKNNFISVMSHELRNPLTPILTSAQLLLSYAKEQDKKRAKTIKEYAGIIEHQAKNMASLLDDLLDISRLAHKKIMLEKKVINLKDAIHNAIKTALPLIHRKQQKLKIRLPDDEIYIEADPVRIEQAIVNILNNASKYTHHEGNITISCQLSEEHLEIAIKDDGVGMKAETIKNIFNLFNTSNFIPLLKTL